jgi:hypothetical protein
MQEPCGNRDRSLMIDELQDVQARCDQPTHLFHVNDILEFFKAEGIPAWSAANFAMRLDPPPQPDGAKRYEPPRCFSNPAHPHRTRRLHRSRVPKSNKTRTSRTEDVYLRHATSRYRVTSKQQFLVGTLRALDLLSINANVAAEKHFVQDLLDELNEPPAEKDCVEARAISDTIRRHVEDAVISFKQLMMVCWRKASSREAARYRTGGRPPSWIHRQRPPVFLHRLAPPWAEAVANYECFVAWHLHTQPEKNFLARLYPKSLLIFVARGDNDDGAVPPRQRKPSKGRVLRDVVVAVAEVADFAISGLTSDQAKQESRILDHLDRDLNKKFQKLLEAKIAQERNAPVFVDFVVLRRILSLGGRPCLGKFFKGFDVATPGSSSQWTELRKTKRKEDSKLHAEILKRCANFPEVHFETPWGCFGVPPPEDKKGDETEEKKPRKQEGEMQPYEKTGDETEEEKLKAQKQEVGGEAEEKKLEKQEEKMQPCEEPLFSIAHHLS